MGGRISGSEEVKGAAEREEAKASLFDAAAEAAAAFAFAAVVVDDVEVTDPVRTATTLPLFVPSHIGEPDCPCVDWQLCAPMLAQIEEEGEDEEHSSIWAKAASVPCMLKKG